MVIIGGALGAPARYLADTCISHRTRSASLPWGTLAINAVGSFTLGVITGVMTHAQQGGLFYAAAATGFCGAFTTFSTFTWETLALAEDGKPLAAAANVVIALGLGLGAAAAGYFFAR
jgi:CrcB protein